MSPEQDLFLVLAKRVVAKAEKIARRNSCRRTIPFSAEVGRLVIPVSDVMILNSFSNGFPTESMSYKVHLTENPQLLWE